MPPHPEGSHSDPWQVNPPQHGVEVLQGSSMNPHPLAAQYPLLHTSMPQHREAQLHTPPQGTHCAAVQVYGEQHAALLHNAP
jgi:hypothetical protein